MDPDGLWCVSYFVMEMRYSAIVDEKPCCSAMAGRKSSGAKTVNLENISDDRGQGYLTTYIPRKAPTVNIANCFSLNSVTSNHFVLQSHFLRGSREVTRRHEASMRMPIMSAVYRIAPLNPTCSMILRKNIGKMTPPTACIRNAL